MIYDTFLFRNELDMLELRLTELESYHLPVTHVLAEAAVDFHGKPKPLFYRENRDRFRRWHDHIIHVVVNELPEAENPWVREHAQRDAMTDLVAALAKDEELILICDADEIPSKMALQYPYPGPAGLLMRTCHSAVDWLYPAPQPGSVVVAARHLWGRRLSDVRDSRPSLPMFQDGGWHLSWLGGLAEQSAKLAVSCHRELSHAERDIIEGGHGYRTGGHDGVQMVPVDVDESWPRYIYDRKCPASWFRPRRNDA